MITKYMTKKRFILSGIFALVVIGALYFIVSRTPAKVSDDILSFEDCVDAGYPVMESYPRQCRTNDGHHFIEELSPRELDRLDPGHAYGEFFELELGTSMKMEDGMKITLSKIEDSRCPEDVECVWAGELTAILDIEGGGWGMPDSLSLGEITNPEEKVKDYTFTLNNASVDAVMLTILK